MAGIKMGGPCPGISVSSSFEMPVKRGVKNFIVKTMQFGVRAQIPSLLLISCVSLDKLLNYSEAETRFPHL